MRKINNEKQIDFYFPSFNLYYLSDYFIFCIEDFSEYFIVLSFLFWGLLFLQMYILNWKNGFLKKIIIRKKLKFIILILCFIYLIASFVVFIFFSDFNLMMFFSILFSIFNLTLNTFISVS